MRMLTIHVAEFSTVASADPHKAVEKACFSVRVNHELLKFALDPRF